MEIRKVNENKKQFLSLLLLADEQEDMVDRYLEKGAMYVLDDRGVKAECVVTNEGDGILEIKNIAVMPEHQRAGYGRALIDGHMIFGMTGRQCQTTIAAGKTLMLDRELVGIDEEAENAHILEAAKKLWGELNHRTY